MNDLENPAPKPKEKQPESAEAVEAQVPLAPRAKGIPIFGNTFQFLKDTSGLLLDSYQKLGPVFRLRALWLKYTVIAGFEARDFLNSGEADKVLSREVIFNEVGKQLGSADFVLGQSGEKHMRLRRLLSVAYSREIASNFVPDFIEAVAAQVRTWREWTTRQVMDEISVMAFEQYCRAMCDRSLADHYRDCLLVTDYNMNVGGRLWPFVAYKMPWYQAARKRTLKLMWDMVLERRKTGTPPNRPATIMDTLMALRDKSGKPLTDDEVVCYSMYGFAGSCSYMGRVIGFMLYEILKDPPLMARLVDEVDEAFAAGIKNAQDVRGLQLLRAVYLETLRNHPVSQGMPHYADKDFVFAGKKVSKGDITVISQVPMSFSKCPFHNPEKFDPDRCLPPRNEHRQGQAFHPFGIGHRTCTATGLVELMALTMVATILHEVKLSIYPDDYQLKLKVKPLPGPDDRFGIRIEERRRPPEVIRGTRVHDEESIYADFPGAEEPAVAEGLRNAESKTFKPDEAVIREGEEADAFYILTAGSARVVKAGVEAATLSEGDYFGEIGLLQNVPRTATVIAGKAGLTATVISRERFHDMISASDLVSEDIARLSRKRALANRMSELLRTKTAGEMQQMLPEFTVEEQPASATIMREGDAADAFYILWRGEVEVAKGSPEQIVASLGPGEYFGEMGLLNNAPRSATVRVKEGASVSLLKVDAEHFKRLLMSGKRAKPDLAAALLERLR